MVSARATASREPAPPSEWPVIPLIEVTAGPGSPNTLTMASDSGRSLAGVEVPWALMWVMASGVRPASSRASSMHADGAGAVRGGRGDVVGVGGAGRPGDLGVDVGARGPGPAPGPRGPARRRPRP